MTKYGAFVKYMALLTASLTCAHHFAQAYVLATYARAILGMYKRIVAYLRRACL